MMDFFSFAASLCDMQFFFIYDNKTWQEILEEKKSWLRKNVQISN